MAWTPTDIKMLDSCLVKKMRAMSMGKASKVDGTTKKGISSRKVWTMWGLVPVAWELMVRRLKWLQNWIKDKDENDHLLAIFFGRLRCEEGSPRAAQAPLGADGKWGPVESLHPWAKQLREDLKLLTEHPVGEALVDWDPDNIGELFFDEYVKEDFTSLDLQALRASWHTVQLPPHSMLAQAMPAADSKGEPGDRLFYCDVSSPDGTKCGASFTTMQALKAHKRSSKQPGHRQTSVIHGIIATNRCINCNTIFADKYHAGVT